MVRNFTSDWFTFRQEDWIKNLAEFKDKECNYLELGTYEGRSLIFMLENILTNEKSKAECIDIWQDSKIEGRFLNNLQTTSFRKVKVNKGDIRDILGNIYNSKKDYFDIIYIDAMHSSNTVVRDACMCFDICKMGGIIIFDDYLWENKNNSPLNMKEAIDCFLNCYKGYYEMINIDYQVIIRKIK